MPCFAPRILRRVIKVSRTKKKKDLNQPSEKTGKKVERISAMALRIAASEASMASIKIMEVIKPAYVPKAVCIKA